MNNGDHTSAPICTTYLFAFYILDTVFYLYALAFLDCLGLGH